MTVVRPIRILHVVDNLARGGLQNGLLNLIEQLDEGRFEHTICSVRELDANVAFFHPERVRILCLHKRETDFPIQICAIARVIREVRPDILHSRNWGTIEAPIAGWATRSCAVVHSEHGIESAPNSKEPWRRRYVRRLAYELADRVLAVSYQLRDLHARRTGFAPHKITVIHNGVDSYRYSPDSTARWEVRKKLGIADHEFCIGCIGNLTAVKDYMTLLRAMEEVAERCCDWRLVVVGEGPERPKMEAFIQAHPELKERVSLLGVRTDVGGMLNSFDVYVLTSITEGISNSLLEAMATGLPAVATATGGNPEVVVDGESGLLFPVGDFRRLRDQLLLLRGQKDLRVQLGREGLCHVRQDFSIASMARKYEEMYESLGAGSTDLKRAAVRA